MKPETWLSLLGAITGLTAMGLQLWQFALSGSRIKLVASHGINSTHGGVVMIIDVKNRGRLACTVESVAVELDWGGSTIPLGSLNAGYFAGPNLPARVDHGSNHVWAVPTVHILDGLNEESQGKIVRALITLSNGKKRRSNKFAVSRTGYQGPIYSPLRLKMIKGWRKFVREIRRTRGAREYRTT